MIAIISLCISAAAFVLAALLPLWEKYAPPRVILVPPGEDQGWWRLKIVNRRREELRTNRAWVVFDDGSTQPATVNYDAAPVFVPARSTLVLDISNDFTRSTVVLTKQAIEGRVLVAYCEDGVGHVHRSRPIRLGVSPLAPLAGWSRLWFAVRWWFHVWILWQRSSGIVP
jgi:hypothetical protein